MVSVATGEQTAVDTGNGRRKDRDLITHTAYCIWHNGDSYYTIAGGAGRVLQSGDGVQAGAGYLIDYNSTTGTPPATRNSPIGTAGAPI